jgi:hypothetical protein
MSDHNANREISADCAILLPMLELNLIPKTSAAGGAAVN